GEQVLRDPSGRVGPGFRGAGGLDLRAAGAERFGEDHHDPHDHGNPPPRPGDGPALRGRPGRSAAPPRGLPARGAGCLPEDAGAGPARLPRRDPGDPARRGSGAGTPLARAARARGLGHAPRGGSVEGDAAEGAVRRHRAARAAAADPRRAVQRPGPAQPGRARGDRAGAQRGRHDDPLLDTPDGPGGAPAPPGLSHLAVPEGARRRPARAHGAGALGGRGRGARRCGPLARRAGNRARGAPQRGPPPGARGSVGAPGGPSAGARRGGGGAPLRPGGAVAPRDLRAARGRGVVRGAAGAVWAVIRREYLQRVRSRWFVLATLGAPLFLVLTIAVPAWFGGQGGEVARRLAVVDGTDTLYQRLEDDLRATGWDVEE